MHYLKYDGIHLQNSHLNYNQAIHFPPLYYKLINLVNILDVVHNTHSSNSEKHHIIN